MDKRYKLIRKLAVTDAALADTSVFEALLDASSISRAVYAEWGYPSDERESALKQAGWQMHISAAARNERYFGRTKTAQLPPYRHP